MLGAFFFMVMTIGVRAQKKPVRTGVEIMVKKTGYAVTDIRPDGGEVQVAGERWSASIESNEPVIPAGSRVVVTAVNGLRLRVKLSKEDLT
jgi:membrane-bound ClpP family serine protease